MLGFFTDPYPDELLYSACARYGNRMRYPNVALAAQEWFGNKNASASIDLPTRINHLLSVLPHHNSYTADRLINHHTLAPIYVPFLPLKRALSLRRDMKQTSGTSFTHERVGITSTTIRTPNYLRFCPLCAKDDVDQYGEKYWHRIHQISGIEICPIHAVFLENSIALWHSHTNPGKFISADKAIPNICSRTIDITNPHHTHLLKLARDVAWILNWHDHNSDIGFLRRRYYNLLLKRGLAYYNGRIKTPELSKELVNFFTQEFLEKLQCGIDKPARGWVYRLVHTNTLEVAQPAIRHLLLITYLGYAAEDFFTASDEFKPFGTKPWPCLNRASDHYREEVIAECNITDSLIKRGRPVGTFRCQKCGFIYNRIGPDISKNSRYQVSSIQAYGPVWEKALRELWEERTLSLGTVGQMLGVSDLTVVRYAIRFELQMNTSGSRAVSQKTIHRYRNFRWSREKYLEHYRQEWIAIRSVNPEASRKELIAMASFLYLWLRKNDAEWIESQLPPPRHKRARGSRVNWKEIDSELSEAVISSTSRIKGLAGKPVRASLAAVVREIGHRAHFEHKLDDLPNTAKALDAHLESLEAFAIRKIEWAESCYVQEGICPTRLQLMVRAVIRNKVGRMPAAQSAVDAAMERLSKELR
jgi:hypothetical protein